MRTLVTGWRTRHARLIGQRDLGTSLVEIVVAMALMSIFGAIFTTSSLLLSRTTITAQALTTSSTQLNQAYQTLDRRVRYASGLSTPGRSTGTGSTGDWYVELRTTTGGTQRCTQLRVDLATGALQQRSWTGSNLATATPFVQIASNLTNGAAAAGSADQPFVLVPPAATVHFQQLQVSLVARSGPASSPSTSRSTLTFTALNSTVPVIGPTCPEAVRP